jgi:hypothetical protein
MMLSRPRKFGSAVLPYIFAWASASTVRRFWATTACPPYQQLGGPEVALEAREECKVATRGGTARQPRHDRCITSLLKGRRAA